MKTCLPRAWARNPVFQTTAIPIKETGMISGIASHLCPIKSKEYSVFDNNSSAEQMKNHLHLDSYVLREQRKQSYYTVLELEFADVELLDQDDYIADTIGYYSEKDENGKYTPFCSMITYCLEHYL